MGHGGRGLILLRDGAAREGDDAERGGGEAECGDANTTFAGGDLMRRS